VQLEHLIVQPTGARQPTSVLLLHGAWHGAWCYDLWAADFAAHGYETHVMSLPGHGNSQRTKSINRYSIQDYTDALAEIITRITPAPFVIGHSMGGRVLQQYLLWQGRYHNPVTPLPGAVLLASIPYSGIFPFEWRLLRQHTGLTLHAFLTGNLLLLVNTPKLAAEHFLTEGSAHSADWLADRLVNESLTVAIQSLFRPAGDPKQITTPVLVVGGERDAIFTVAEARATAATYRGDFILIPAQGHNLMMERDWQSVAGQIRGWLEKHS